MLTPDDLPELLDDLHHDHIPLEDLYDICLYMFEEHEPEAVMSRLPPALRERLTDMLRSDWDNDAPLASCSIFSAGSDRHPGTDLIVSRTRAWLAAQRTRAA